MTDTLVVDVFLGSYVNVRCGSRKRGWSEGRAQRVRREGERKRRTIPETSWLK